MNMSTAEAYAPEKGEGVGPTTTTYTAAVSADGIVHGDATLEDLGSDAGQLDDLEVTEEDNRRILRRIDCCLLPVLAISYMFQFLDKQAMGYTAILDLRKDLHLTGQSYSWAGSIFYFGYLAASWPIAHLLVRFPVGKTLASSVCAWAVVLMLMAACTNAGGLLAARFFLGMCEAAVAPGFSVVTSMWYKRSEQPLRHGAWFMGNVVSGLFGSILAYSMANVRSETLAAWQAVFIIFGAFSLAWSVTLFWTIPDSPTRAWFLKGRDDAKIAVARVKGNLTGIKSREWKWGQCVEALKDPQAWLFVLIQLCGNIPNGGVTTFASVIVNGLGFSVKQTLLIGMVATAFQVVYVLLAAGGATLLRNTRTYWLVWNFIISLIGAIMAREIDPTKHIWAKFFGYCLLICFSANFPLMLSLTAANVGGFTKKNTVNAMLFVAYCVGNIIGPQLFFDREAPTYQSGFLAMLICFVLGIIFSIALRVYYIWENKRRDGKAAVGSDGLGGNADIAEAEIRQESAIMLNLLDRTDRDLPQFRYVY
ncbi:Major facilitator superfamily [Lasiodiplodia theobromae]|uniref:MFS allantoate transporter n=1 Tax=Lasiodiplodia theobromae TaxID=45133 RepID=UPI0015C36AB0|nr:MFS allantoate transporter [Lasiodiplodia theobromae]KAF4546006.1 MFS allantoate transporter [Lasiodiplodia theobromae]KAF9635068.1 Major facilitator superfamily [Lasiodiplodia theobromae]